MSKMPEGGAKELIKTSSGREYLKELRKKHELDIIQPSDPRFSKVYAKQSIQEKKLREETDRLWEQREDQKRYEEKRRTFSSGKRYF